MGRGKDGRSRRGRRRLKEEEEEAEEEEEEEEYNGRSGSKWVVEWRKGERYGDPHECAC